MKTFLVVLAIGLLASIPSFFKTTESPDSPSSLGVSNYYEDDYQEEYEDEPLTSDNWECTDDCSGHEAGYEWAADKGIDDPDDCGGNSESFIEGCQAWANEQIEAQEYEGRDFWEDSADRY